MISLKPLLGHTCFCMYFHILEINAEKYKNTYLAVAPGNAFAGHQASQTIRISLLAAKNGGASGKHCAKQITRQVAFITNRRALLDHKFQTFVMDSMHF